MRQRIIKSDYSSWGQTPPMKNGWTVNLIDGASKWATPVKIGIMEWLGTVLIYNLPIGMNQVLNLELPPDVCQEEELQGGAFTCKVNPLTNTFNVFELRVGDNVESNAAAGYAIFTGNARVITA